MKRIVLSLILISMLVLAGCAKDVEKETSPEEPEDLCPNCDDGNVCTDDICNEGTDYKCEYSVITPCCGNKECEEGEDSENCASDCEKLVLSEELQTIITNQQKIKSYRYSHYGNKIADRIYVKDDKIRYDLNDNKKGKYNNMYDVVYLDTTNKEATLSCIALSCENRYETEEADYKDFTMDTPMDMIEGVTYKSDILQTEICDTSKPCNKVEVKFADGTTGFVWMDNYYGFPYKIEKEGTLYDFVTVAVNSLKDEDVTVPS